MKPRIACALAIASFLLRVVLGEEPTLVDDGLMDTEPYIYSGLVMGGETDGVWAYGSGALVHPRVFLTAAHVIFDGTGGLSWVPEIEFYLGQHDEELSVAPVRAAGSKIYSSYSSAFSRWRRGTRSDALDWLLNKDFAAVYTVNDISDRYGAIDVNFYGQAGIIDRLAAEKLLLGYPQDHIPDSDMNRLHQTSGSIEFVDWLMEKYSGDARQDPDGARYAIFTAFGWKTFPGSSGGPLYVQDGGRWLQVGVLVAGSVSWADSSFVDVRVINESAAGLIEEAIISSGRELVGRAPQPPSPTVSWNNGYCIDLAWETLSSAPGAAWEIARRDGLGWEIIGVSSTGFYQDLTAEPGIIYGYKVRAIEGLNRSPWSRQSSLDESRFTVENAPLIGAALGAPELRWIAGGHAPFWRDEQGVRSGKIGSSEESWVSTTIEGPATFHYKWKVASEEPWDGEQTDFLALYVDDEQLAAIGGETGPEGEMEIPAGVHKIRIEYAKDYSFHHEEDLGRVLEASFSYPADYGTLPGSYPLRPGWRESLWLGYFYQDTPNWIYHFNLGWAYVSNGGSANPFLYLSNTNLGWIWTGPLNYPWLYSFDRAGWFAHAPGTDWIFNGSDWEKL